jgi:hypothetical protein
MTQLLSLYSNVLNGKAALPPDVRKGYAFPASHKMLIFEAVPQIRGVASVDLKHLIGKA